MSQTADFLDMVNSFSVPGVQLQRYAPGAYGLDGRYIQGSSTLVPIVASIQQPSPAQLKRMPEGLRVEDTITVYTSATLNLAPKADRIAYKGDVFEVQALLDWVANGNYVAALCTRVVTK